MAATTLARDVLYRVSAQLTDVPDSASQFKRWTEKELVAWLNDGQRVIAKWLPRACSRIDIIKLSNGTRQSIDKVLAANIIHGDGTASTDQYGKVLLDIIRSMGEDGQTPGRAIGVFAREQLDSVVPGWHNDLGTEVSEYCYDIRTPKFFYVYPGVDSVKAQWVEIAWQVIPREIAYTAGTMKFDGSSTATISIDDDYVDDLVNYILARGHLKDAESAGNAALAQAYVSQFVASINAQAKVLTGVNPNLKTLPLTPDVPAAAS